MSLGACAAARLAAAFATLLLAACGSGNADGGDIEANRLVLTDDTCTYEGDDAPPAGELLEIGVFNPTFDDATFELVRIEAAGSFEELEAHVEEDRQRLEDGVQPIGPPAFATVVAQTEVPSGNATSLIGTVTPAPHAVVCTRGIPPSALFLVGPLEPSEES